MVLDGRHAEVAQVSPIPGRHGARTSSRATTAPATPWRCQHAAPELEALLPTTVDDIPLTTESILGSTYLGDDAWSTAVRAELTKAKKTDDDLKIGVAYDTSGDPRQLSITLYRAEGVGRRRDAQGDGRQLRRRSTRPSRSARPPSPTRR